MDTARQQQLRALAENIAQENDHDAQSLAKLALELLDYTNELLDTIEHVTQEFYEAIYVAYEYGISDEHSHEDLQQLVQFPQSIEDRAA